MFTGSLWTSSDPSEHGIFIFFYHFCTWYKLAFHKYVFWSARGKGGVGAVVGES